MRNWKLNKLLIFESVANTLWPCLSSGTDLYWSFLSFLTAHNSLKSIHFTLGKQEDPPPPPPPHTHTPPFTFFLGKLIDNVGTEVMLGGIPHGWRSNSPSCRTCSSDAGSHVDEGGGADSSHRWNNSGKGHAHNTLGTKKNYWGSGLRHSNVKINKIKEESDHSSTRKSNPVGVKPCLKQNTTITATFLNGRHKRYWTGLKCVGYNVLFVYIVPSFWKCGKQQMLSSLHSVAKGWQTCSGLWVRT